MMMNQQAAATTRSPLHRRLFLHIALLCVLLLSACSVQGAAPAQHQPPPATPPPTDMPTAIKALLDPMRQPTPQHQPPTPTPLPPTPAPLSLLAETDPAMAAALQQVVDNTAALPGSPGVVLLIDIPNHGRWVGAAGLAERSEQVAVLPDDQFRIASVTKMFVATIVLQLAQEGALSLDDPVETWLPGLVPGGDAITIRHLLNHTSGLYDYLDGPFVQMFENEPQRAWEPEEMVAYGVGHAPHFAPGEPGQWRYSNTNYILLGMIVEKASGATLGEQLRQRITAPLAMEHTYLEDEDLLPDRFVHGYVGERDYQTYNVSFAWAAGGIVSNAADLATFMRALAEGRLLNAATQQELLTFATIDYPDAGLMAYPIYGMGMARNVEALSIATMGAAPTITSFDQVWGHIGGLTGYKSVVGYMPDTGITVVALVNNWYTQVMPVALHGLLIATGQQPTE